MRIANVLAAYALLSAHGNADAVELEVVAVVDKDPELQIVVAPGGTLPDISDVRVQISGTYAEVKGIRHLSDTDIPLATAIAVDTSGSMSQAFPQVQDALRTFVQGMKGADVVLVTHFDERVEGLNAPWQATSGQPQLLTQIQGMRADGNFTHLYEGLNGVVDRLVSDAKQYPLRTVLVLSDGADTGSPPGKTLDRARTNAIENKIRIHGVGYVPGNTDSTKILEDLASDTRATYKRADGPDAIRRLFLDVQNTAHDWAVLSVAAEAIPPGVHELRVEMGPTTHPDVATYPMDLKRSFRGEDLPGNDVADPTARYAAMGIAGVLLTGGALLLVGKSRRQREAALAASVAKQVEEAKEAARQAALEARAVRPTVCRLMTANGMIELFPQGKFGNRVIGSDAAFAELVLAHDSVSRKHAQLERREDDPNALYVTDLGSSNGTYHQGLDIRGRGTVRVGNRERLQFGLFAALVDISEE